MTNERLEIAKTGAVAASHAKSEFIANMSHEIRTPMNGILGMVEILLDSELTGQQRGFVRTVWESAEDLLSIINDVLDFSKAEAGKLELESAPFSPRECAERVAELMGGRAHLRGIELVNEVESAVPDQVVGDGKRLRQILTNIVGNAIKFTEHGEVIVRQTLVAQNDGVGTIRFDVTDTGIGVSPQKQRQIFEGFAQADTSATREYGGTGLGLTVSKHLVEMMDGTIGVTSTPGEGSTFWFTVNVAIPEAPASEEFDAEADFVGCRVLIVDDNASNRAVLENQISAWGGIGTAVTSGHQALATLHGDVPDPFDVALIDLNMPGMDGAALARSIRANPRTRELSLALLTSSDQATALLDDGSVDASIAKPVRQGELRDCLAQLTGRMMPAARRVPSASDDDASCEVAVGSRILVAEDNEINQEVATRQLQSLGCQVDVARDGAEAIDAVRQRRYDLVFMDCQMPKLDGYQAARRIRVLEDRGLSSDGRPEGSASRVPIVALTAHSMPTDRARCLDNGMDDFLSKPFTRRSLRAVLERWLGPDAERKAPTEQPPTTASSSDNTSGALINDAALEQIHELDRRGGGNGFATLVRLFGSKAPVLIEDLHRAIRDRDTEGMARVAHALKSSSLQLGAERMGEICRELERLGREGSIDGAEALAAETHRLYPAVTEALEERLVPSSA